MPTVICCHRYKMYNISPLSHDYVIGTLLFGVGVMLLALAKKDIMQFTYLPTLGRYTLGVYVSHILFTHLLDKYKFLYFNPFWAISYAIIIYILALLLTLLMSRNRCLMNFVL